MLGHIKITCFIARVNLNTQMWTYKVYDKLTTKCETLIIQYRIERKLREIIIKTIHQKETKSLIWVINLVFGVSLVLPVTVSKTRKRERTLKD